MQPSRLCAGAFCVVSAGLHLSHRNHHQCTLHSLINESLNRSQTYIISVLFMVYGLYLGALLIAEMTVYVMGRTQGSSAFQRKIDRVNHEMEYYTVPFELQTQVRAYYDYIWVNQKQYDEQIGLLSDKTMSTDLKRKVRRMHHPFGCVRRISTYFALALPQFLGTHINRSPRTALPNNDSALALSHPPFPSWLFICIKM